MPEIPSSINGVTIEFSTTVNKEVSPVMIDGLRHCIKTDIASDFTLNKIYISSANDSHTLPSRHSQSKAVDISRINGTKMAIGYPQGGELKAIVDAIQDEFESFSYRRENFGPHLKKKLGNDHLVSGHEDHIHISVN